MFPDITAETAGDKVAQIEIIANDETTVLRKSGTQWLVASMDDYPADQEEIKTLLEKVWETHAVRELPSGQTQLFIGLHLVHEVTSPQAFEGLRMAGRKVRRPEASPRREPKRSAQSRVAVCGQQLVGMSLSWAATSCSLAKASPLGAPENPPAR